jgi:hypothetical protein
MKGYLALLLGFMGIGLATVYFVRTYEAGNAQWEYPVLAFGMAFILYYSIFKPKSRNRR